MERIKVVMWIYLKCIRVNYYWKTDSLRFHTDLWKSRESVIDDGNVLEMAGLDWIRYFQWSLNISANARYRIPVFGIMSWSASDSAEMICIPWNSLWKVVDSIGFRCGNICFVELLIKSGVTFCPIGIQWIPQLFTRNSREYKSFPRNPMHPNS